MTLESVTALAQNLGMETSGKTIPELPFVPHSSRPIDDLLQILRDIHYELKRHNDILSPPKSKRGEAEYGRAVYQTREERERAELDVQLKQSESARESEAFARRKGNKTQAKG